MGPLQSGILNSYRQKLIETKLIVIDEISMVSVKMLYDIDYRLREIYGNQLPFGGKPVLAVGHLRQIPPVAAPFVFTKPRHLPTGNIVGNHLWDLFRLYELTEIMRQKGDAKFCKALNNLAEGCLDDDDFILLKSREITDDSLIPSNAIHLFLTNEDFQKHNFDIYFKLKSKGIVSIFIDTIQRGTPEEKENLKNKAKALKAHENDGLLYKTQLQAGAIY